MSSNSRQQLEDWLKTLEVKGKCLDVGGSASSLKGRVKVFEPKEYLIMDNNAERDWHEKWIEPDIKFNICIPIKQLPYEDEFGYELQYKSHNVEYYFDQIFMIEVSEYLTDPLQVLKNVNYLLKEGGKFYSSWHFVYPKHNPEGKDLLRYTDWGVKKLHELAGFKDIKIIPRVAEDRSAIYDFYNGERMRAIKGYDHGVIGWLVEAIK